MLKFSISLNALFVIFCFQLSPCVFAGSMMSIAEALASNTTLEATENLKDRSSLSIDRKKEILAHRILRRLEHNRQKRVNPPFTIDLFPIENDRPTETEPQIKPLSSDEFKSFAKVFETSFDLDELIHLDSIIDSKYMTWPELMEMYQCWGCKIGPNNSSLDSPEDSSDSPVAGS